MRYDAFSDLKILSYCSSLRAYFVSYTEITPLIATYRHIRSAAAKTTRTINIFGKLTMAYNSAIKINANKSIPKIICILAFESLFFI